MLEVTPELKQLLIDKLQQILETGETVSKTVTITSKTVKYNGEGEVISRIERSQTNQSVEIHPPPKWAYDYIWDSLNINTAIQILEREGFSVTIKNADMVRKYFSFEDDERSESSNQGLSEETIAAIKRKILGINE